MPIEFQCQSCNKTLRVPDEAVGQQVKCPSCQQISTVSAASNSTPSAGGNPFATDPKQGQAGLDGNPYAAPSMAASRADAEPYAVGHGRLDAAKAVTTAWMLFKENIGMLVGAFILIMVVNQAISFVQQIIQVIAMGGQPNGGPNQEQTIILILTTVVFTLINMAVQGFLWIGLIRIQLSIARGQQTSFGVLFSGGGLLVKMVLANLLFSLVVGLGMIALIVPGIYFALRYWSYSHFIVDRNCGIMESFKLAGEASKNNLGETFLLGLIGFGLVVLGILMLCIGMVFTIPVSYLSLTVAYLMMTSRRHRQAP